MRPMKSLLLTGLLTSVMWAADIAAGTWVLDVAKSQPGGPTKSLVITVTVDGDKETVATLLTLPDGTERRTNTTIIKDGKEHPASDAGLSMFDTYVARRVHDHESLYEFSKEGKVVHSIAMTFAKGGKTKTVLMKNTFPNGKTRENTLVFDRQ